MSQSPLIINTGVAIILVRGDQVCLSKRTNTDHYEGCWQFPGGRQDEGEEIWPTTVLRELKEETGLKVPKTRIKYLAALRGKVCKWCYMYLLELKPGEEPKHMEPEKCTPWQWFPIEQAIKMNMIDGTQQYLRQYLSNYVNEKSSGARKVQEGSSSEGQVPVCEVQKSDGELV